MYYVFRRPPHRPRPQQWIPSKALVDTGSDDFERAGPATRWAAFGGFDEPVISGGAVYAASDGITQFSVAFPSIQVEDQYCEVIFEAAPASNTNFQPAVYARISALTGTPNYYAFRLVGVNVRIIKATAGTPATALQEAISVAYTSIEGIKIEAIDDVIKGYLRIGGAWVEEISYTDPSPFTGSGYVGIGHSAAVGGSNPQGIESAAWGAAVATVDAEVVAVPAVAAGDAPAGVISAGSSVTAVPAVALATAPPANQIISAVVNAPAVTITAAAPAAVVTGGAGGTDATVVAVPAVAAGDAPSGVLAADAAVVGVASAAAGDAPAGVLSGGSTVGGVPALALADAPRPEISPSPEGSDFTGLVAVTFSEGVA